MSAENTERLLAELAAAQFAPPERSFAERKAELYPRFKNFAKITRQYIDDPQILAELEALRKKLQE
ncbi:MAG: hypothetical protein LBJ25_00645 [Candidatus Margulisbacteria bacterium]|jgi:hypothetical protein|nr:hypothetical protein [Candidatus Margulisiibacteriota bacterium]